MVLCWFLLPQNSHWKCSKKELFLKILQNSKENNCPRFSFLIKLQASATVLKETQAQVFSCEIAAKFLRTAIFKEHHWQRLPLPVFSIIDSKYYRFIFTKWSNLFKQFVGKLPTNCLSVFDHFVGFALKELRCDLSANRQPFKELHVCIYSLTNGIE